MILIKVAIILLLSSYVRACGLIMRKYMRADKDGAGQDAFTGLHYAEALKHLVKSDRFPDLYPLIQSGAYMGESEAENPTRDDLAFGLERILDGIEVFLQQKAVHDAEHFDG